MNTILLTTGDINKRYKIIDVIQSWGQTERGGFLGTGDLNLDEAFTTAKEGLITKCRIIGGDAIICCRFYYRSAVNQGLTAKQVFEVCVYGTAVKFIEKDQQPKILSQTTQIEELMTLLNAVKDIQNRQLEALIALTATLKTSQSLPKNPSTQKKTSPFKNGDFIKHAQFGQGQILLIDYVNKACKIQFEKSDTPKQIDFEAFKEALKQGKIIRAN